jgi:hypothetical protein
MVNDGNSLHIAAFDETDGDLKYIYVPDFTSSASGNVKVVSVDQFGMVGYWTSIKLKPETNIPYIAYYNASETGSRDSIKIAWLKVPVANADIRGVDDNGFTTGNWEFSTVPARDAPSGGTPRFQRVNLDFKTNGDPILGYLATNIEFSYPVGEAP